jgi:4-hydroxy-2-oxoheptanedioate aldolase
MQMYKNEFKRALAVGEKQIGIFLGLANGYSAELLAGAGFDWLMIDGEHGPNDIHSILAQLQAIAPYAVHPVVRTVDHDPARIKQLLDIGVQSLVVPMVESSAQAEALVRAMRYPPHGIRGVGTALARAAGWNGVEDYFAQADQEMCLIVQVESQAGLDALDDILQVEGVDAVFIGPSDLAGSLGYLGKPGHPEVIAAVERAIARISAAGKASGVFSADTTIAASFMSAGACFLAVGVDTLLLRNAAVNLAAKFKATSTSNTGAAY